MIDMSKLDPGKEREKGRTLALGGGAQSPWRQKLEEIGKLRLFVQGSRTRTCRSPEDDVSLGKVTDPPCSWSLGTKGSHRPKSDLWKIPPVWPPLSLPGAVLGAGLTSLPPSQWCEPADPQRCLSALPGLPRGPPASGAVPGERLWGRRASARLGWHELTARCGRPWPLLSSCLAGKRALWGTGH